jgi:hypothetical protein
MDADHFDAVARSLSRAATRRTILGIVAGAFASLRGFAGAAGKKKKKKKKKKKESPPALLPPPPPTCATTGCPWSEVCQAGVCVDCIGQSCTVHGQCCTNYCGDVGGGNKQCTCLLGTVGPEGGCTSDSQCCNHNCIEATGKCACDPTGTPCFASQADCCCSGVCLDENGDGVLACT